MQAITDPAELTSGSNPYYGRALLSYDPGLAFADLFANVEVYDNHAKGFEGDKRGRYFTHLRGGMTAYAEPIGVAAEAARIESKHDRRHGGNVSFTLTAWGDRTLVVCESSSLIGSTWVAFISTDSIPAPVS